MSRWFSSRESDADYFCVIGSPIEHSKSPLIHAAFAAQTGRELVYDRVEVLPGQLAAAVTEFRGVGGRGMNVTVPLKQEAFALTERRMERAEEAGAANTLWFDENGAVVADNTDGSGLMRDLEFNQGIALVGKRLLLIGAGGAARAVVPALAAAAPAALVITNRTEHKATAIAKAFAHRATIETLPWGADLAEPFDIVVNATSLSLQGELPAISKRCVHSGTVCYDMMYANEPTVFETWARAAGVAHAFDGLGMLVEQAAEAFLAWYGVRPETAAVIAQIRASLAA